MFSLDKFANLKYGPMKEYLGKKVKGLGGGTRKAQFVETYKQYLEDQKIYLDERKEFLDTRKEYLSAMEPNQKECAHDGDDSVFRQKLHDFEQCTTTDLACMLKALGLSPENYSMLLKVNCTKICSLRKEHLPLAIVADGSDAVGIQTSGGVVRIPRAPLPPNKPVVHAPTGLLDAIRSARPLGSRQTADVMQQVPNKQSVDIRKVEGGLLVAIREAKERGLRSINGQSQPTKIVDMSDTSLMSRLKTRMEPIRRATEQEDEDDSGEDTDWD